MTTRAEAVEVFEIQVERDEGFSVNEPGEIKPWQGWRVKYRTLGSRGRWSKFLTADDLAKYDTSELQAFCAAHKESGRV
jgi:hypothetical protein